MIGVKSIGFERVEVEATEASLAYQQVLGGGAEAGAVQVLHHYLRDQMWAACGRLGLVAVVHTGVWAGNYADPGTIRPTNVLPMALAHRDTRFDLFHAGTPWPADAGMVARATHNVWLNLCWSHLISPVQAEQALDLWLDYVPQNRIFAFGGDYWWNVENVYGALTQCREVVARSLAKRVSAGQFGEARALQIARKWFHDNPREAYEV
jgi:predicted TIM-barrel fold metal-dependent hydrolase